MIRALDTLQNNFDLLLQRQANLASNIANANTPGYMEQNLFQSTLREVRLHNYQGGNHVNAFNDAGSFTFGNQLSGSSLNPDKGALKTTGLQTDFAIPSAGFFNVQLPNGQVGYTRNGNFRLNSQDQLVTQDGYAILSQAGQPIIGTDNPNFKITTFASAKQLTNLGNTYYTSTTPGETINTPVQAGMLEQSNVKIADQMTAMIQISREYEANQRVLSMNNATLDKAVNRLGSL
jgi:flagellar basal-body rod protein FlgF